jgi:predicted transcriptional regulator
VSLGRVQKQVLASLINHDATVDTLAWDWPGLSESSVRGAVGSLYQKGMVEPVRWERSSRVWSITKRGSDALDAEASPEDGR